MPLSHKSIPEKAEDGKCEECGNNGKRYPYWPPTGGVLFLCKKCKNKMGRY